MDEQVEMFFQQIAEAFRYLEQQYGYRRQEGFLESPEDFRDTVARIRYVGSRVGIEIWWYFAGASIGVAFIELLQPGAFPEDWAFFDLSHNVANAKAVSLYDLVEMLGHSDDPNFLVKDFDYPRQLKKRAKILATRMPEVLAGLARATLTYATNIVQGDTTIFPEAMDYYAAKVQL